MRKTMLPLLGLLLALTAGCESPGYKPPRAEDGVPAEVWKSKVVMNQAGYQAVQVLEVRESVVNELLTVQITLKNRQQAIRSVRTRFDWFDDAGMLMDTSSDGWIGHVLQPAEVTTISATAETPGARDWRLNLNTWKR